MRLIRAVVVAFTLLVSLISPAVAEETKQTSWIDYQPWYVGLPEPVPGQEKGVLALHTDFNSKVIVVTTGPVEYTDSVGDQPYFDPRYKSATTLVIVEGQGALVRAFPKSAWVGITNKPVAGQPLGFGHMSELVDERSAEILKYQPNTDSINVLWIRNGRIYFKGSMPVRR